MLTYPASLRLAAVLGSASQLYTLSLASDTSLRTLTQAALTLGASAEASTLELATLLPLRGSLEEADCYNGDRLLLQLSPPKPTALPAWTDTRTHITIRSGTFEKTCRGMTRIVIGKSQLTHDTVPEVDTRLFVPSGLLDFVSENSVLLYYDPTEKQWLARKIGQTRVWIQDYELHRDPFPINNEVVLRLYPPAGSMLAAGRVLAELYISIEAADLSERPPMLPIGSVPSRLMIGMEQNIGLIEASGALSMEAIIRELLHYQRLDSVGKVRLYRLHTLSPDLRIGTPALPSDRLLYLPRESSLLRSTLRVRSLEHDRTHVLYGSVRDETFTLGCRTQATGGDVTLDIDLYDHLRLPMPPSLLPHLGHVWATIQYDREASAWWVAASAHTMPLFLDGRRLGTTPLRVATDRVLSIGIEGTQLVLRYALEPNAVV